MSLSGAGRLRHYAMVMEAGMLLLIARLTVASVPMRYWRGSLGTICAPDTPRTPEGPSLQEPGAAPAALRRIAAAVERATLRLPLHLRCLPRAMAVQWMARRRGLDCTLRIGIERGSEEPLHAWIDWKSTTLIGRLPERSFVQILEIRSRPGP